MASVVESRERGRLRLRRGQAVALVVAVLLTATLVRSELVDMVRVESDSMAPTTCSGDLVLVSRWNPRAAKVNDIVIFSSPVDAKPLIKRVVGVTGQSVAIEDGQLVVDGRDVLEPYVDLDSIDGVYYGPVQVPNGTVLVMGDHREVSVDSRSYGPVPVGDISGRRLANVWSSCPS